MSRIHDIYDQIIHVTENIAETVAQKKAQGQKIVGMLPVYTPEELVHAGGMFPVGCWGGTATISRAAKYFPPFACSIMQAVMEFADAGVYKDLDAFVVPTPCDTLKGVSQNLLCACPDQKVIILSYPQNNKLEAGVRYAVAEFKKVRKALEDLCGHAISDESIHKSIQVYNEHRSTMTDFLQFAADHPGAVSAVERHYVVKSGYFMDKEEHTALVRELTALLKESPTPAWSGKKIILSGIMAEPNTFLSLFDEEKLAVVGDELAHESRQLRTLVPEGSDPLERLALQWQNMEACSVIWDPCKKRARHIVQLAQKNHADGVVYCQMKFCDPEEFDFPSIMKACQKAGIPLLNLEVDQLVQSTEQARTRIQAFSEQLNS